MSGVRSKIRTASVVLGLGAVVYVTTQYQSLVVTSGSMEKGIPKGSMAFAQEVDSFSVKPGDVVKVLPSSGGTPYIHRVKKIYVNEGKAYAVTQGDAVPEEDREHYLLEGEISVVKWHLPYLGGLSRMIATPIGLVFSALGVLLLLLAPNILQLMRGKGSAAQA